MSTPFSASPLIPPAHAGCGLAVSALPDVCLRVANVQSRACADWLAICQETLTRCASARGPLELMAVGSLMMPACVAHTMHYCRSLSEAVQAGQAAAAEPVAASAAAAPAATPAAATDSAADSSADAPSDVPAAPSPAKAARRARVPAATVAAATAAAAAAADTPQPQ